MAQPALTQVDVIYLGRMVDAVGKHGRFSLDGDVVSGTFRHVVESPDNYGFPGSGRDIRDGFLRVTLDSGSDITIPVTEVVEMLATGCLAVDS